MHSPRAPGDLMEFACKGKTLRGRTGKGEGCNESRLETKENEIEGESERATQRASRSKG